MAKKIAAAAAGAKKPKMAAGDRVAAKLLKGRAAMGARTAAGAKMTGGVAKFGRGEIAKVVVSRSGGNT